MQTGNYSHRLARCAVSACLFAAASCSSEQGYHAGQAWQQNRCNQLIDRAERDHCVSRANMGYDEYQRQRAK